MTFEEKKSLVCEAMQLIEEFETSLKEVRPLHIDELMIIENKENESILIKYNHHIDGEIEIDISSVDKIFEDEIEGYGSAASLFYEGIENAVEYIADKYGDDSKETKMKIEELTIIERRCEKIQARLREVSKVCA